jgi:peptidoglycan hydrolase CwlO-like protein
MPTPATLRERVEDMQGTLAKMHAVLKQMRAKATASSKDPLAKANLEMWELLVAHLDKQFQELRVAMVIRDDMEARRAAMYKQVDAKAETAAQAARSAGAGKVPPAAAPAAQGAAPGTALQTPAGVAAPPPPNASPSPK